MDKVQMVHSVWNQYAPNVIHQTLSKNKCFNSIILSDGTTKLLDLLLAMNDCASLEKFLHDLKDVNATIPHNSPLWPGCTVLHLAILMTNNTKLWDMFFAKSDSKNKLDSLFSEVYGSTEYNRENYQKRIVICLENGCRVTIKSTDGTTPIHLAFKLHKIEIIDFLLNSCLENSVDFYELPLFHIACATGNEDSVKRLLDTGANISSRTKVSFKWFHKCSNSKQKFFIVPVDSTALHVAVIFRNERIINLLLDLGADVYAQNALGLTPMHLSMSGCRHCRYCTWTAKSLFNRDPNLRDSLSDSGLSHLHVAAYVNDSDAIKKLLDMGSKVDIVFKNTVPKLKYFVRYANRTPLYVAIFNDSMEAAITLIKNGADFFNQTPQIETPIQVLLRQEYLDSDVLNFMKNKLINDKSISKPLDINGMTLLHIACYMFDFDEAKKLLEDGADVNTQILHDRDSYRQNPWDGNIYWKGSTAMHLLIETMENKKNENSLKEKFVKLLLKHGANVLIMNSLNFSPLLLAHTLSEIRSYDIDESAAALLTIADLLLINQHSYKVNPIDNNGFSHFHYACQRNQVDVVRKFVNNGIDINHTTSVDFFDDRGTNWTPLHLAMRFQSKEVAHLLIKSGANLSAKNEFDETPFHIATREFIDSHLFEILISHGADINARDKFNFTPIHHLFEEDRRITREQLQFIRTSRTMIDLANDFDGLLGIAMANSMPCDRELILEELIDICQIKNTANNYNPIVNIVSLKSYHLTVDFYMDAIQRFVDMGYTIDQPNKEGKTALNRAVHFDNLEAIEALLLFGSNINLLGKVDEHLLDRDSYFGSDNKKAKILATHIWKMQYVDLKVNEFCENTISEILQKFPLHEDLRRQWDDELTKLSRKDMGWSLTIRSFLSEWGAIIEYPTMMLIQRENVDKFFGNTKDLRRDYPQFSGLLMMQYKKAQDRLAMYKTAMSILPSVLQVDLPHLCLDNILNYFDNDDLCYFIEEQRSHRLAMQKIAMSILESVLQVDLPNLCLENILNYFDNDDLYYFMKGQCPGRKILVRSPKNRREGRTYARVAL